MRLERRTLRRNRFKIYRFKRQAIRNARGLTHINKEVYWVIKESNGYYVVNLSDVQRLNKNTLKGIGGSKIRTKDLDKICVWRSPKYSTLIG